MGGFRGKDKPKLTGKQVKELKVLELNIERTRKNEWECHAIARKAQSDGEDALYAIEMFPFKDSEVRGDNGGRQDEQLS